MNLTGMDLIYIRMDDINNFGIENYEHMKILYLWIKSLTNVEGNDNAELWDIVWHLSICKWCILSVDVVYDLHNA